ncbi:MAG: PHB depolymerase family esterase [Sphingomicrobium sp.]
MQATESVSSSGRLNDFGKFGSLKAKAYIPDGLPRGAPLVVVLHGCTQNPAGYDRSAGWSQAADELGFALLCPEQSRANNPNLCFNWYLPQHAARGRGEPDEIRQMIVAMQSRHGTDPARTFVTGLSAGGAMTAVMLATYPELFAGGAVIAGLPFGTARNLPEALDRMRGNAGPGAEALTGLVRGASTHAGPWPTLSVWHGSSDAIVDPSNADALIDQWRSLHGVAAAPSKSDRVNGYPHRVWCDAAGRAVIEDYAITGMAHGTPLDPRSETGEVPAPHMLDAGISSTRLIARFWGLDTSASAQTPRTRPVAVADVGAVADGAEASRTPPAAAGVGKTIEDALRAAGLMR